MWKKIINYKYTLKDLKFFLWFFPIVGLTHAYNLLSALMFQKEFRWIDITLMVVMILGFMDIKKKLKNKDYRTA
ncbi:hypothetical protein BAMA_20045 [Bacillus manliponensis]|uniref:Uncharacterized protein n=1 Tax=Bacillus manliponensis TaxID=574376 RepID=A0A073K485_9BACI|nr:hypothetical protein [Bacillus manliponensis]KEK17083.1 hypothetical protein BAMA_20045 [Bacillus manliponensis]